MSTITSKYSFSMLTISCAGRPSDIVVKPRMSENSIVTSVSRPPFSMVELALDDLLDDAGRNQALDLGARLGLALDAARQARVLDRDRGLLRHAGADLQVLLGERVRS